ncbi:hypothetical protein [Streptomyces sp. NPDC053431]|uniref:hypothetical protein n=1 Tax=Streptomyces sp. NPDC053431 TaxID=3365703 RepID=UPI0037CCDF25
MDRLDQNKMGRTINVTVSVWEAGKKRAAVDGVSVSHANHLIADSVRLRNLRHNEGMHE